MLNINIENKYLLLEDKFLILENILIFENWP